MNHSQTRYINPLTDFGFKKLFGTEPNKELLIDFLNQILPAQHKIKDLNFDENKESDEIIHLVELKNQRNEVFYDKLKFIYIELPKFKKTEGELETHFDKWLYVFRHLADLQKRPQKLQDKVFEKLFDSAEIAKLSKDDRDAYEESLKYYRDIKNVVDTSKQEGIVEGIEQGIDKRNLEIARVMKNNGESVEKIIKYTNLTQEEIGKL